MIKAVKEVDGKKILVTTFYANEDLHKKIAEIESDMH